MGKNGNGKGGKAGNGKAGGGKKIIWTYTDEAPMLATYSLLPIVQAVVKSSRVTIDLADISVAGRIIAACPEKLTGKQKQADELTKLGKLCLTPDANIIKLPNVSASIPQLKETIKELNEQGYKIPEYPEKPETDAEKKLQEKFKKTCIGSVVNPVLREGNSDRRSAVSVKNYAKKHPHRMGKWESSSKTHVASMPDGDYFGSEKSIVSDTKQEVKIVFAPEGGDEVVMKEKIPLTEGEIMDCSTLDVAKLRAFFEKEMDDCKKLGILLSLHMKCTMMKVSDPIVFGHAVSVYFKDVFAKYEAEFKELKVNPNLGLGDLYKKISGHAKQAEIEAAIKDTYTKRPRLAMVNSAKGITNLHVPSDVIIDASMPPMIRDGGKMWNENDKTEDSKCIIPDRSYAGVFQTVIDFCKKNGALIAIKPTLGTVPILLTSK